MIEQMIGTGVVMVIGFAGNALYLKGVFATKIDEHERRIGALEDHREETCQPEFRRLGERVAELRGRANGAH